MIQRIQSVWLLLAALTLASLFFFPVVVNYSNASEYSVYVSGLYQKTDAGIQRVQWYLPLLISTIAIIALCLFNIFNFKNRTLQKRLSIVSIILTIGLSFWCRVFAQKIPGGLDDAHYTAGTFLPSIAVLFLVLAISGINRDDKLIRSADRLR